VAPDPTLGAQLQSKFRSLNSCVSSAEQLCARLGAALQAALQAYEAHVLADQQPHSGRRPQHHQGDHHHDHDQQQGAGAAAAAPPLHPPPAAQPADAVGPPEPPPQQQQQQRGQAQCQAEPPGDGVAAAAAAASAAPQPEELLFVAQALQAALERELALMARVAAALALDAPAEELASYATLWELQPYLHEEGLGAALARLHQRAGAARLLA
jgi:hypothetical protein